jgi:OOP family OmpA-OmpF porin
MMDDAATSGKLNTWSIGAHIGHVYDLPTSIFASSSFKSDLWGLNGGDTKFDIGYGLYVEKQISPIIGVQLGYDKAEITGQNSKEYYEGDFSTISLAGTVNFSNFTVKRERNKFGFYGKFGAAVNSFESQRYFVKRVTDNTGAVININRLQDADKTRLNVLGGLGLRYHVSSNFRIELESVGNWVLSEDFDGDAFASTNGEGIGDTYLYTTIGAAYTFGRGRSMHEVSKNSKDYFWDSELAKDNNTIDSNYIKSIVDAEVADTKADVVATKEKLAQLEADLKKQRQMLEDYKKESMKKPVVKAIPTQAFQVYFATGSDYINEEYQKVLTQLGAILKDNKELKATVTGFTDKRGAEKLNSKLRERRAKSVKKFLIKNIGIEKDRISTDTSTQNIIGGDVYHLNRKVEVILK